MDNPVMLYRAVQNGELADVMATGTYRALSGTSVEGKYFFETAQRAARFAKKMYQLFPQEGPYTLTSAEVLQAVMQASTRLYVAGEGRFAPCADSVAPEGAVVFVPTSALPCDPVQVLDYIPIP